MTIRSTELLFEVPFYFTLQDLENIISIKEAQTGKKILRYVRKNLWIEE